MRAKGKYKTKIDNSSGLPQNKASETIFYILESSKKVSIASSNGNSVFNEIDNVKC